MGREYFLHGQFPAGLPSGQEHNTDVGGQSDKAPPETFRICLLYTSSNILDAMGNTPTIQLNHMVPDGCARVLVKFEGLNVGGSIKTRTAYNMIREAQKRGLITKDTIIVEPTSGNQGIGLARTPGGFQRLAQAFREHPPVFIRHVCLLYTSRCV